MVYNLTTKRTEKKQIEDTLRLIQTQAITAWTVCCVTCDRRCVSFIKL